MIVHSDQTGFIPNRHIYFNLRCLFNILYTKHNTETVVMSVNAQKAFDQVKWPYETLNAFCFGKVFIDWIRILYAHPTARSAEVSSEFPLLHGTRQGDPSSPYLFDLVVETLATKIRQHPRISPVSIKGQEHHLSLYADDNLLYVSNPKESISSIMEVFNHFGSLSGFQINWEKSKLMPVHLIHNNTTLNSVPFKIATDRFTYLGVSITRKPDLLFEENWNLKMKQLKQNTEFWKTEAACEGTSLLALLDSPIKISKSAYKGTIMIHNSIKIRNQIKSHLKALNMYTDTPICNNHAFKPSAGDSVFAGWREKGVGSLSNLYQGGHLMSFE